MSVDSDSFQQLTRATSKELVLCSQREARLTLAYDQAAQLNVLPVSIMQRDGRKILLVAAEDAESIEIAQAVRFITGLETRLFAVTADTIRDALFEAYHREGDALSVVSRELHAGGETDMSNSRAPLGTGDAGRLLSALLDTAFAQKASDVQLSPRREGYYLSLRVDGRRRVLKEVLCSSGLGKKLIGKIKVLSNLDPTVHTVPQDGSFEFERGGVRRSVRVSFLPTIHGAQVALRLFGAVRQQGIDELFADAKASALLKLGLDETSGLVLLAGATGSGKTRTQYAAMRYLVENGLNVVSIEDPAEAEIAGVSQTSINPELGLTYPIALKSSLRQDPDAILIGEIRDHETARIACEAALTGHLVLSTVHGGNVREAIIRLRQMVGNATSLLTPLKFVLTQRLISELCPSCRVLDLASANRFSVRANKAVGCAGCDYTGVSARLCVAEALYAKGVDLDNLPQQRIDELEAEGLFISPKQQLIRLFTQGRIDVGTVSREAFDSIWEADSTGRSGPASRRTPAESA